MNTLNSADLFKIMEIIEKKANRTKDTDEVVALWDIHFKTKNLWFETINQEKQVKVNN